MLLCLRSFFQSMTRDHKFSPVLRSKKFHDGEASWTHVQDRDSNPAPGMSSSPIFVDYWVLTSSHVHITSFCSRSWPCCGLSRLWNLTAEWGWDLRQSSRQSQSPRPSLLKTGKKTLAWPKRSIRFTQTTFWPTQYLRHQIRGQRHKMGVCCGQAFSVLTSGPSYARPSAPCCDHWCGEEIKCWDLTVKHLLAGQEQRSRRRERISEHDGGRWGWDESGE